MSEKIQKIIERSIEAYIEQREFYRISNDVDEDKFKDEVLEQMDIPELTNAIMNQLKKGELKYQPNYMSGYCDHCYRFFGDFNCENGMIVSVGDVLRNGSTFISEDFLE